MELVIINPRLFKGGTATRVNGLPFFIVKSSFTKRNPGLKPVCQAANVIPEGEVLSVGGSEPLKPIPPPSAPTCTATTEGLNFTVDLPPITTSSLTSVGALSAGTTRNLVLSDCGAGATPYVTFTDNNDQSNRTSNLRLSPDSKASGVGIRLVSGDHNVQLGAQHTTVSKSNVGQFLLGTSTADGSTLTLPLQVHYVRTGSVVPGKLKAAATVTIVYP
jgi:type 1 fimbria pilin